MSNFGTIKNKILTKLTESYESNNKTDIKGLMGKLKSSKDLMEVYTFYEEVESLTLSLEESKTYVKSVIPALTEKMNKIKPICEDINNDLSDVESTENPIYECLDILCETTTIRNAHKKIEAEKELVNFLTQKKESIVESNDPTISNEFLLHRVLVDNFNSKYVDSLNEENKSLFSKIVNMSGNELISEMDSLKEDVTGRLEVLLEESNDQSVTDKLTMTKEDVVNLIPTKHGYYKLLELKEGLV